MADSQTTLSSSTPGIPGKNFWKEYTHQDGRKYYYHTMSKQTVWQKPNELKTAKEVTSWLDLQIVCIMGNYM